MQGRLLEIDTLWPLFSNVSRIHIMMSRILVSSNVLHDYTIILKLPKYEDSNANIKLRVWHLHTQEEHLGIFKINIENKRKLALLTQDLINNCHTLQSGWARQFNMDKI